MHKMPQKGFIIYIWKSGAAQEDPVLCFAPGFRLALGGLPSMINIFVNLIHNYFFPADQATFHRYLLAAIQQGALLTHQLTIVLIHMIHMMQV